MLAVSILLETREVRTRFKFTFISKFVLDAVYFVFDFRTVVL